MSRVHIEALVNAVGDVVMNRLLALRVDLDILRVNGCGESEGRLGEERSRLGNHLHLRVREELGQTFVNDFRDTGLDGMGEEKEQWRR